MRVRVWAAVTALLVAVTAPAHGRTDFFWRDKYLPSDQICKDVFEDVLDAVSQNFQMFDEYRAKQLSRAGTLLVAIVGADASTPVTLMSTKSDALTDAARALGLADADVPAVHQHAIKVMSTVKSSIRGWNAVGDLLNEAVSVVNVDGVCRAKYGGTEPTEEIKKREWNDKWSSENCASHETDKSKLPSVDFCKCVMAIASPMASFFTLGGSYFSAQEAKVEEALAGKYVEHALMEPLPVGTMLPVKSVLPVDGPFPGTPGLTRNAVHSFDGPCLEEKLTVSPMDTMWIADSGPEASLPEKQKLELRLARCRSDWLLYRANLCAAGAGTGADLSLCRELKETDVLDRVLGHINAAGKDTIMTGHWTTKAAEFKKEKLLTKDEWCTKTFAVVKGKGAKDKKWGDLTPEAPTMFHEARAFFYHVLDRRKAAMKPMARLLTYIEKRGGNIVRQHFEKSRSTTSSFSLAIAFTTEFSLSPVVAGMYVAASIPLMKLEGNVDIQSTPEADTPEARGFFAFASNKALSKLSSDMGSIAEAGPFVATRTLGRALTLSMGIIIKFPGVPFFGSSAELKLGVELSIEKSSETVIDLGGGDMSPVTHAGFMCSAAVRQSTGPKLGWGPIIGEAYPDSSVECGAEHTCDKPEFTCCRYPQTPSPHMLQEHKGYCVPTAVSTACCQGQRVVATIANTKLLAKKLKKRASGLVLRKHSTTPSSSSDSDTATTTERRDYRFRQLRNGHAPGFAPHEEEVSNDMKAFFSNIHHNYHRHHRHHGHHRHHHHVRRAQPVEVQWLDRDASE